jgi:hypothetical protein
LISCEDTAATPTPKSIMSDDNFARVHQTLRVTPAMEAGITDHVWSTMKTAIVVLALASVTIHTSAQTLPRQAVAETYESADIDADGSLRVVTTERKTIVVPKGGFSGAGESFGTQTEFGKPVISADKRVVGAQAMFANCCTSYDIPLQLVVYSRGTTHRFQGGLAIFDWHFVDGGRRVAFSQQTVHFACSVHWELRDVATERLVAEADIPEACGENPDPPTVKIPRWVGENLSGIK